MNARTADVGRCLEGSVQAIAPGMIGAADPRLTLDPLLNQKRAAVAAHVMEGAQVARSVAEDQDRLAGNRDRDGRAGLAHLVGYAHKNPAALEKLDLLLGKEFCACVERRRQAGCLARGPSEPL